MNKKAGIGGLIATTIIGLILILVITNIIYIGDSSLFNLAVGGFFSLIKKAAESVIQSTPYNPSASETAIPKDMQQLYVSFHSTLKKHSESDKEKCYIIYNKMPESDYKIILRETYEDMWLILADSENHIIDQNKLSKLNPCMVAGGDVTKNFYENWIDPGDGKTNHRSPDYQLYYELFLNGPYDLSGYKLDDKGILYKASKNKICFIPTISWTTDYYTAEGIRSKYINNIKENMEPC